MSGVTKSFEKLNAREVLVSSDIMRLQTLASRDDQDLQGAMARSIDSSPTNPTGPGSLLQILGSPISGLDVVPTFTAASGYTATLGAGAGFLYDPGLAGLSADDSAYLVARWSSQTITFTTPSGANPRIDLVVATPAMVDTDSQSRNILVDPVARTITPQNVFKTTNPVATVAVIAGTPASSPVPPAVPAGSLGVMYVWVPASAPSAANFAQARAAWRRAPYPFAAMSGIIAGMGLKWDLTADPTAASAGMIAKGFHRICIDGEVMEFYANIDSTAGGFTPDTANNPFGVAAGTSDKPYFLYACGGRHNPMPSLNTSDGILSPVTIVESLTPPNLATGKPSAALTTPVGSVLDGAVYVGLGFLVAGATRRRACMMIGDMTYFGGGDTSSAPNSRARTSAPFDGIPSAGTGFASAPSISTKVAVVVRFDSATPGSEMKVFPQDGSGGAGAPPAGWTGTDCSIAVVVAQVASIAVKNTAILPIAAGNIAQFWVTGGGVGDICSLEPFAYNHGVRMFGASVNP